VALVAPQCARGRAPSSPTTAELTSCHQLGPAEVDAFVPAGTYTIAHEPGPEPKQTVYRLYTTHPIPVRFSTMIGDAVHNLRSALDCAAFALARRHVARELNENEQLACEFPIRGSMEGLEKFFARGLRPMLYGPREQKAIRDVQPGWLHDEVVRHGSSPGRSREEEVSADALTLLNRHPTSTSTARCTWLRGRWTSSTGSPTPRRRFGGTQAAGRSMMAMLSGCCSPTLVAPSRFPTCATRWNCGYPIHRRPVSTTWPASWTTSITTSRVECFLASSTSLSGNRCELRRPLLSWLHPNLIEPPVRVSPPMPPPSVHELQLERDRPGIANRCVGHECSLTTRINDANIDRVQALRIRGMKPNPVDEFIRAIADVHLDSGCCSDSQSRVL